MCHLPACMTWHSQLPLLNSLGNLIALQTPPLFINTSPVHVETTQGGSRGQTNKPATYSSAQGSSSGTLVQVVWERYSDQWIVSSVPAPERCLLPSSALTVICRLWNRVRGCLSQGYFHLWLALCRCRCQHLGRVLPAGGGCMHHCSLC